MRGCDLSNKKVANCWFSDFDFIQLATILVVSSEENEQKNDDESLPSEWSV